MVYSTDRSKADGPGVSLTLCCFLVYSTSKLIQVLPCVILLLCFSVLLVLRLPRLGKRELIVVLFVRLFDSRLLGFVCFFFLLVSGKLVGCDCGTPWTFLLLFLYKIIFKLYFHGYIPVLQITKEPERYFLHSRKLERIFAAINKLTQFVKINEVQEMSQTPIAVYLQYRENEWTNRRSILGHKV